MNLHKNKAESEGKLGDFEFLSGFAFSLGEGFLGLLAGFLGDTFDLLVGFAGGNGELAVGLGKFDFGHGFSFGFCEQMFLGAGGRFARGRSGRFRGGFGLCRRF